MQKTYEINNSREIIESKLNKIPAQEVDTKIQELEEKNNEENTLSVSEKKELILLKIKVLKDRLLSINTENDSQEIQKILNALEQQFVSLDEK